jgi:hypothetical protein
MRWLGSYVRELALKGGLQLLGLGGASLLVPSNHLVRTSRSGMVRRSVVFRGSKAHGAMLGTALLLREPLLDDANHKAKTVLASGTKVSNASGFG